MMRRDVGGLLAWIVGSPLVADAFGGLDALDLAYTDADPLGDPPKRPPPYGRYRHHYGIGKAGATVVLSGLGVGLFGAVVWTDCNPPYTKQLGAPRDYVSSDFDGGPLCEAAPAIGAAGGVTVLVGESLMFYGAIRAHDDIGRSPALGWVGLGVGLASLPLAVIEPAAGVAAHAVGLTLGAVHYSHAGRLGRRYRLVALPTANGALVAGTF